MRFYFGIVALLAALFPSSSNGAVFQSARDAFSYQMMVGDETTADEPKKTQQKTNKTKDTKKSQDTSKPQAPKEINYLYNQEFASKLFKIYSGKIKLSYPNIPSLIHIAKDTTVEISFSEENDAFWNVDIADDNVQKIYDHKDDKNQRTIILKANELGKCTIMFDYISTKDNQYKVLKMQKLILNVSKK